MIKIQKYEKGADRNLKINKYISEIKYYPEKITIKFKDIAESDLSENVSSRTAARRPFSDSLLNQESPDTEAGFGVANSCIQEALEDSRGVLSGHLKRVRPEMYAPPIITVKNFEITIKNIIHRDRRNIKNVNN